MKNIQITILLLILVGCNVADYKPIKSKVIAEQDCESIFGNFTPTFENFKNYSNLGFWEFRKYDKIVIQKSDQNILFSGYKNQKLSSSLEVMKDQFECKNGILTVNIENQFENNGGVSVYEARKIQFYSYSVGEVVARFQQTSSGLAFLIPVSIVEDSMVKLHTFK